MAPRSLRRRVAWITSRSPRSAAVGLASGADRPRRVARACLPVVVPAVPEHRLHFARIDVVEGVEAHADILAAELLEVAAAEAADAAVLAAVTLGRLRAPLIETQVTLPCEDPKALGLGHAHEQANLRADRAVTAHAARRVDLDLELHRAAVAAPRVLAHVALFAHRAPPIPMTRRQLSTRAGQRLSCLPKARRRPLLRQSFHARQRVVPAILFEGERARELVFASACLLQLELSAASPRFGRPYRHLDRGAMRTGRARELVGEARQLFFDFGTARGSGVDHLTHGVELLRGLQ